MPQRIDVQRTAHDLHLRTLSKIPRPLDRLMYLASTRDYSTGRLGRSMEAYMASIHTSRGEFLAARRKLAPYRVAIPVNTDPLAAEFLFSNLKVALGILDRRN